MTDRLFDPAALERTITVLCYDRSGRLVDVIQDVSLGDRHQAATDGLDSLHAASLWAALAADTAQREHPAPPATRQQWYDLFDQDPDAALAAALQAHSKAAGQ